MSLTAGTITCRAYYLVSPPVGDFLVEAQRDLKRHAFRPVRADRAPRSIGWINPRDVLDTELRMEKVVFENFLTLGLRVDKLTVNARMLKAHFNQALRQVLRERSKKQLSREERAALLEKTRLDLLAKQSPTTSLYEMAWNLETHHVYFSATGNTLNTEFCDLFQETFHTGLVPLYPYVRAERKVEKEGLSDALLLTRPAVFGKMERAKQEAIENKE